jgi:hypothetical protein
VFSGMLRRVALVRTDVSEEFSPSFIRRTRIGELGTTLAVTSNRHCKTPVLTRATRCNTPEDTILHGHRRGNHKSYVVEIPHFPSSTYGGFDMTGAAYKTPYTTIFSLLYAYCLPLEIVYLAVV